MEGDLLSVSRSSSVCANARRMVVETPLERGLLIRLVAFPVAVLMFVVFTRLVKKLEWRLLALILWFWSSVPGLRRYSDSGES